jgi:hypothetical protein
LKGEPEVDEEVISLRRRPATLTSQDMAPGLSPVQHAFPTDVGFDLPPVPIRSERLLAFGVSLLGRVAQGEALP